MSVTTERVERLLDDDEREGYDQPVAEPRTTEQPRPPIPEADVERARIVAKIERGLADVEAGRVVSHAEVMKRIEARYPGSQK